MFFEPEGELLREMSTIEAGVWIARPDNNVDALYLLAKLPTPIIKSIYQGAIIKFGFYVLEVRGYIIDFLAIEIADTEPSFVAYSWHKRADSRNRIISILSLEKVTFHLYDEGVLPVLTGNLNWNTRQAWQLLKKLEAVGNVSIDTPYELIKDCDEILYKYLKKTVLLRKIIIIDEYIDTEEVTFNTPYTSSIIGNPDPYKITDHEGSSFEIQIHNTLLRVFDPIQIFRSPYYIKEKKKQKLKREVADLIVRYNQLIDGVIIIQAKNLAIFDSNRTFERRAKSIQKDINNAISQLKGTIGTLREDKAIYHEISDQQIQLNLSSTTRLHAIVLIPEMHSELDWSSVKNQIFESSDIAKDVYFHIFELSDFDRFVIRFPTPEQIDNTLIQRWLFTKANDTVFIKGRYA